MSNGKTIDVAVLGATGSVGQRFIELLECHPWFAVREVVASDRSTGKRYGEAVAWRLGGSVPSHVADLVVKGFDEELQSPVVFSALPGDVAVEIEQRLASQGHAVLSNSSALRMAPDVPLVIPEINPDHLDAIDAQQRQRGWSGFVVTNPNCSAIHLLLTLKPIFDAVGIDAVMVTTMQAVSGAGYPGVPSLDMVDNVVPFISSEEEKMVEESRKILGQWNGSFTDAELTMSAACNRVPVRDGHTECVSVRTREAATPEAIGTLMREFRALPQELELPSAPRRPVVVVDEPTRPQPILDRETEGGMASVVGRIRSCPVLGCKYVLLGHNTIRGAAGASILNAELLRHQGRLPS